MKHTSRKKMLLSSIAMLLVALVALGSATYAWFTISKTVTADGMVVKAVTTAGLEISNVSATTDFDSTASFGQDASDNYALKPISWNGATSTGFLPSGNITDSSAGTYSGAFRAENTGLPTGITLATTGAKSGHNSYFAEYDVWVRSAEESGTRTPHTVEAQVTVDGDDKTFVRAQLVDNSTAKGIYADTAAEDNSVVAAAGSTKTTYSTITDAVSVTGTDSSTNGKPFKLIVWFDGEDAQCFDNNKNKTAEITISFTATDM